MSTAEARVGPVVATAAALIGAAACAWILQAAEHRADAVAVVPVALVWGAVTMPLSARIRSASIVALVAAAVLVRLPLVGTPPLLSDDLYRYLFEGTALNAGFNPFVDPPLALTGLDDVLRDKVNHPEVTSVYPPLALWWFRLLAVAGTTTAVQFATLIADVVTAVGLRAATRRDWPAWMYALHPLAVLESAQAGHVDVLAVAVATLGVVAWRRGWLHAGWWGLVAGGWIKLLPAVLLPALWPRIRHRPLLVLATVGATVLLAAPVIDGGAQLLVGLHTYTATWAFNGLVFSWVANQESLATTLRPVLLATGAVAALVALFRHRDPGEVWAVVGAAFVLLSPTMHPWYALWAMVPALLCRRWGWAAAAVPLLASYSVLAAWDPSTGLWREASWLWWVTWPPALLALCLPALFRRYSNEPMATAPYPAANSRRNGSDAT